VSRVNVRDIVQMFRDNPLRCCYDSTFNLQFCWLMAMKLLGSLRHSARAWKTTWGDAARLLAVSAHELLIVAIATVRRPIRARGAAGITTSTLVFTLWSVISSSAVTGTLARVPDSTVVTRQRTATLAVWIVRWKTLHAQVVLTLVSGSCGLRVAVTARCSIGVHRRLSGHVTRRSVVADDEDGVLPDNSAYRDRRTLSVTTADLGRPRIDVLCIVSTFLAAGARGGVEVPVTPLVVPLGDAVGHVERWVSARVGRHEQILTDAIV